MNNDHTRRKRHKKMKHPVGLQISPEPREIHLLTIITRITIMRDNDHNVRTSHGEIRSMATTLDLGPPLSSRGYPVDYHVGTRPLPGHRGGKDDILGERAEYRHCIFLENTSPFPNRRMDILHLRISFYSINKGGRRKLN